MWREIGDWLFNVTCNDISVIYVTAHRFAGRLKKLNLRSGSKCHIHFVGFFNVPVKAPKRGHLFICAGCLKEVWPSCTFGLPRHRHHYLKYPFKNRHRVNHSTVFRKPKPGTRRLGYGEPLINPWVPTRNCRVFDVQKTGTMNELWYYPIAEYGRCISFD